MLVNLESCYIPMLQPTHILATRIHLAPSVWPLCMCVCMCGSSYMCVCFHVCVFLMSRCVPVYLGLLCIPGLCACVCYVCAPLCFVCMHTVCLFLCLPDSLCACRRVVFEMCGGSCLCLCICQSFCQGSQTTQHRRVEQEKRRKTDENMSRKRCS